MNSVLGLIIFLILRTDKEGEREGKGGKGEGGGEDGAPGGMGIITINEGSFSSS